MKWLGMREGWDEYECLLAGLAPGLYWYWFVQDIFGDKNLFGCENPWQLTVYEAGYATPAWFDAGVTYHIFVDRFNRAGNPPAPKSGRNFRLHEAWGEAPDLYPVEATEQNFDFFGGDLKGIGEKLEYLQGLGVTTIYLSPIFEAASNHRYDTGDYKKIDPLIGDEEDFRSLCSAAGERGMRVILDGVFNHTGSDSRYFNAKGLYDGVGAAQSQDSPYSGWYRFRNWPDEYDCWWGVKTLPQVNKLNESYLAFTLDGEDSVIKHWLAAGASGFRLDVADELPREYLERLRCAAKGTKPDAVIIGEVWEDASNKVSYGARRRYLQGRELDGAINYPAKDAIVRFLTGKAGAAALSEALMTLDEHYPEPSKRCMMNVLGTHDTARILNVLACGEAAFALSKPEKAAYALSAEELRRGSELLKLASALQYMLPGSPCLYYGDEAGLAGFEDPLNRRCYPWGGEEGELLGWYRALGAIRRNYGRFFADGRLEASPLAEGAAKVGRKVGDAALSAVVNRSAAPVEVCLRPGAWVLAGNCEAVGSGLLVPARSVAVVLEGTSPS